MAGGRAAEGASAGRRVAALLPMAYNGVGPSATCVNLMWGMTAQGLDCAVHLDVARRRIEGLPHVATVPAPFGLLPYRLVRRRASPATEARYLADLRENDVAYLWPTASLAAHREAARRGAPIVLEGINTRMASAKRVLDAVYAEAGLPPTHGISEARIAEEDEKLALAEAIFCPSPGVETAAREFYGDDSRILPASYGVETGPPPRRRTGGDDRPLRVLFVGTICLRKGVHKLLEAWRRAGLRGELSLVGEMEPAFERRFADALAAPSVKRFGFRRDVRRLYAEADVFVLTSFEEGDALVTYEAAAAGAAMIVSPAGGGRLGADHPEAVRGVDPWSVDDIAAALTELAASAELRDSLGRAAAEAVQSYSWTAVAARRANILRARYGL